MAINQTISPLPTPPSTTDPSNFSTRADAFLATLPTLQTQFNIFASQANSTASDINAKEASATTQASNAAASATTSAGSATAAASSASNAASSAAAAASSATAAASSASSADTARVAAEAALKQFNNSYLGPKATDPTTDNSGDPLTVGDQYFNTDSNKLKVYNGSSWVAVTAASVTVKTRDGETVIVS